MSASPVSLPPSDRLDRRVTRLTPFHRSSSKSAALQRVELFGLDFIDAPSVDHIADALLDVGPIVMRASDRESGPLPIVVTPNVDHLINLDRRSNQIAGNVASRASLVLPDGQPIVWASRLLSGPLTTRLPGSSLVESLWPRIIAEGRRAFVVSSSSMTAQRIDEEGEHVAAIVAPMLNINDSESFGDFIDETTRTAAQHGSQFVFVGLGFPKQCNIIDGMVKAWPTDQPLPIFLAIGASFEMYYRFVKRAPLWMQRYGLEWLFRFTQEPRRLFRRYFVDDVGFLRLVARSWRTRRRAAV